MAHILFRADDLRFRVAGKGITLAAIGTIARRGVAFCGPTTSARQSAAILQTRPALSRTMPTALPITGSSPVWSLRDDLMAAGPKTRGAFPPGDAVLIIVLLHIHLAMPRRPAPGRTGEERSHRRCRVPGVRKSMLVVKGAPVAAPIRPATGHLGP